MVEPANGAYVPLTSFDLRRKPIVFKKTATIKISLKQWRMFHAVVDYDGFGEAAEKLHTSQSSISHALAKLQEQLGVSLLTLKGRKAQITEEGRILLEHSRELVKKAIEVEELAESLRRGWSSALRLTVHPCFPRDVLVSALRELVPDNILTLSVREATENEAEQALHENATDFAISTRIALGFVNKELIKLEHLAVAHPENPFFALHRDITFDDLETQHEIMVQGSGEYRLAEPDSCPSRRAQPRSSTSLDKAVAALRDGRSYAWLPKYQVQQLLDDRQLRVLPLISGSRSTVHFYLNYGRSASVHRDAQRFAEVIQRCCENMGQHQAFQ